MPTPLLTPPQPTVPHPHPLPDCSTESNGEHDDKSHERRSMWIGHSTIEHPRNPKSYPQPWLNDQASSPIISPPPPATLSHLPLWPNEPHVHHHPNPIVWLPQCHPPPWLIQANPSTTSTNSRQTNTPATSQRLHLLHHHHLSTTCAPNPG